MNADPWAVADRELLWGCLLFAAGYFLATRRCCRRAAAVGLLAVGLAAVYEASTRGGVGYWAVLHACGVSEPEPLRTISSLAEVTHYAVVNGLLVWAVVVGRRPADADPGERPA